MNKAASPRPQQNTVPAVVEAGSLYTLQEVARRCRWKQHSVRQARRLGLPTIRFGSRDYVLGSDVLSWFKQLREQQQKAGVGR